MQEPNPTTNCAAVVAASLLVVFCVCLHGLAQQPHSTASEDCDRGIKLYQQGDTKGAIRALSAAVKHNKEDGEAWYYLGLARIRADDFRNARKAFEAASKLRPDFGPAHSGYAYAMLLTDRTSEAGLEATHALELNSQDADAHYILGVVHLRQQNNDQADEEAEKAIKLNPDYASAYLLKSQALLAAYAKEAVLASRLVQANPRAASDQENSKLTEESNRRKDLLKGAANALENYLKLNPQDGQAALWREQLETLRVFSDPSKEPANAIMSGKQVTTKVKIVSKTEPGYTERARQAGVSGTVILRVVFALDGTVKHILVLHSLPYGLTEQAVSAARKIKFTPATKDGKPVSMFAQLEYTFSIY
jgi:TonB family protein